jgi:hypothetical protein
MCHKRTFRLRRAKMFYLITKALISGVIIMAASEAAKRSPTYGADVSF